MSNVAWPPSPSTDYKTWSGTDSAIASYVRTRSQKCLDAYRANPLLVVEHANIERATTQGGYGHRQIYELVQNGADALTKAPGGRIQIVVTPSALYCANEGAVLDTDGIDGIMSSHISLKRGMEIGRFGLGFKSVLGVTNAPEIYSRSGSFGFDAALAERTIRGVLPRADRFPILRTASTLDARKAAHLDPALADLMSWAATVIKLPCNPAQSSWLMEDVKVFPAEFLLFCPHVGVLILEDRVNRVRREIHVEREGDDIRLVEEAGESVWKVFRTIHTPSAAARKDAGELADRDALPVMWAVPLKGRVSRGRFWAFFPTEYFTTLSGIVNAPWKTNEDRQNILEGVFNSDLVVAAAKLVALNIPNILDKTDPGRFLELLPARGREAPNWVDQSITDNVYKYAVQEKSIPDQSGTLRHPDKVHLHPANLPLEALDLWSGYSGRPNDWCHPSIETLVRRPRAERLMALAERRPASIAQWLEALTTDGKIEGALAALRVAVTVIQERPQVRTDILNARIIPTSTGKYVASDSTRVFLPPDDEALPEDIDVVDPKLAWRPDARVLLERLGLRDVDPSARLESLLARTRTTDPTNWPWPKIWSLVGQVDTVGSITLLHKYNVTKLTAYVKTLSGEYRPIIRTLLPGPIIPLDADRDATLAIDIHFHEKEIQVLQQLGATAAPTEEVQYVGERWFSAYQATVFETYLKQPALQGLKVQEKELSFNQYSGIGPLEPLLELSIEGRARFTETLLIAAVSEKPWRIGHTKRPTAFPNPIVDPPLIWMISESGYLRTELGVRRVRQCVSPLLNEWRHVLPVAECSTGAAGRLRLAMSLQQLSKTQRQDAFAMLEEADVQDAARFYAAASYVFDPPSRIRSSVGKTQQLRETNTVTVVVGHDVTDVFEELGVPFIRVDRPEHAEALITKWCLLPAEQSVTIEVQAEASGPETPLMDLFPLLAARLDQPNELTLVPCTALREETTTSAGKRGEDRNIVRRGSTLWYADHLSSRELLNELTNVFGVRLADEEQQNILEHRELAERRERIFEIRSKDSLAGKLLAAIGSEAIRRRLPAGLLAAVVDEHKMVTDLMTAQLALAVYGVETLHIFRDDLRRNGLEPPVV